MEKKNEIRLIALHKLIKSKSDFYIWSGNELLTKINKLISNQNYLILNGNELGHLLKKERYYKIFKYYQNTVDISRYIFVKKEVLKNGNNRIKRS